MKYEGTKLHDFQPREHIDGLEVIDLEAGTGDEAQPGARITAHYTGALVKNGVIFQSSLDFGKPVTFALDQVIKGWTIGVPGMRVGGTRRLIIPSEQAYGSASPAPNIPANSDLVFDIDLIAIQ